MSPPIALRLPRDVRGRVAAGDQLKRRQIGEIAIRIRFLIDGKESLGQIAHDRARPRVVRGLRHVKFKIRRFSPCLRYRNEQKSDEHSADRETTLRPGRYRGLSHWRLPGAFSSVALFAVR